MIVSSSFQSTVCGYADQFFTIWLNVYLIIWIISVFLFSSSLICVSSIQVDIMDWKINIINCNKKKSWIYLCTCQYMLTYHIQSSKFLYISLNLSEFLFIFGRQLEVLENYIFKCFMIYASAGSRTTRPTANLQH